MANNLNTQQEYSESRRIIRQAQRDDQLVLCVGAGVSINSGMPSWGKAIGEIQKHLKINGNLDYLAIPQYYYNLRGKNDYNSLMRKVFKYGERLSTNELHKLIMRFNSTSIITTNYDNLLEQAAEENGEIVQVISCDSDLPYRSAGKELIKMHGDFEHDNFVLKEDDYSHYSSNFKLIENYIKSIIGSKVVLFIGYSFSDPDLRQIFSWVKDILGNNVRRAYLIDPVNEYDSGLESYYRNWGINVIFSKALNKDGSDSIESRLAGTLNWLLESENLNVLGRINDTLKDYKNLNYVYEKYITQVFEKENVDLKNNCLVGKDEKSKKALNKLFSWSDEVEKNAAVSILEILKRSSIKGISRKQNTIFIPHKKIENWQSALEQFDYQKLIELKKENDIYLSENNPLGYLIQAIISYYLTDYVDAYNYLKRASQHLYHYHMYEYYFISQLNRERIGKIILKDYSVSSNIRCKVKREIAAINLEKTVDAIPHLNENNFLRDILHSRYLYELFQDVYEKSQSTKAEANTYSIGLESPPAYQQLRETMEDFWKFEQRNYIIPRTQDFFIYRMYIHHILLSTLQPDKEEKFINLFSVTNRHAPCITKFDLHIMLQYMNPGEWENDEIRRYLYAPIKLDDKAQDYLNTITQNLSSLSKNTNLDDMYWHLIIICGYIQLSPKVVETILNSFIDRYSLYNFVTNMNSITMFIKNIIDQKLYSKKVAEFSIKLLDLIFEKSIEEKKEDLTNIVISLRNILYHSKMKYKNFSLLKELNRNNLLKSIVRIYDVCDLPTQKKIKELFETYEFKKSILDWQLYQDLVIYNIIPPLQNVEDEILAEYSNNPNLDKKAMRIVLLNLCLNQKELYRMKIEKIFEEDGTKDEKWVINPKEYNYKDFSINWLKHYNAPLIRKLSENKDINKSIRNCFIEAYGERKLDSELMDIYFHYFAK